MTYDLIRALPVAMLVCLVPGWFWTRLLLTSTDAYVRVAFSVALSMALVPATLLVPTQMFGSGITLTAAVAAPLLVFATGLFAYLRFGPAKGPDEPIAPRPAPLSTPALSFFSVALALGLGVVVGVVPGARFDPPVVFEPVPHLWAIPPIALLVLCAGVMHLVRSRRATALVSGTHGWKTPEPDRTFGPVRRIALPAVVVLALFRGYSGPVLHDWPFIRGVDHYSHAVMAQLMMTEGEIEPYLIYPPGFHSMTATISRLSGLEPLELFPVLAPLLLVLPALALYTLADRLWGGWCGVAAALFSVLLGGTYYYYNDAMYPNLVTSQFLMVLVIAALVGVYPSPCSVRGSLTARSGLLFAMLGSSVMLYHQVASMYLAVLLTFVGLVFVPYLLLRDRSRGIALFLSLALLGLLSVIYAWGTYELGGVISGLLSGSSGSSSTGTAVMMAVGTQYPYLVVELVGNTVSQPVAWLGLLGMFVAASYPRRSQDLPHRLAYLTVLLWTLVLAIGACTTSSGFPQRFGRDLGVPLAVFAALGFVVVLRSLSGSRRKAGAILVASLAVLLASTLVGARLFPVLESAAGPSERLTVTPEISAAGAWLEANNEGGNIMVSPHDNQVPSRMMLAMGGYSALQSFVAWQLETPRDLPPTGPGPFEDVLFVMNHPADERTGRLLEEHDVRYVVLYKEMPDRQTKDYWRAFEARPGLYPAVFENEEVLIVAGRSAG